MNDPLLNTTGISVKVVLQAHGYGNGIDLVIVDMRHRILLRSALSFDNWGKFVSGREAAEMATMHAPVLHELVDQALAPLDHKVQVVPVKKPATPPPSGLESRAESFFAELFRLLQKHRVSLDVDTDLGVHFDETYRPSECLLSDGLGIVDDATGKVLQDAEQERVIESAMRTVKNDVCERDLETDDIAFPSAGVTMDGVLSDAVASIYTTDPAIPAPPVDHSLAPALVDVKGMHRHRFADNPEEQRFASAFERDFGLERLGLRYLLRPASEQSTHALGFISDRDREVAATMIQWLGSPVGQGFLRDLGYERNAPDPVKRRPASSTSI